MKTFTFTRTLPRCLLCAAASLAGCAATTTPVLDSHFGEAVTLLKQQQILYPDAASNTNPYWASMAGAPSAATSCIRSRSARPNRCPTC